MVEPHDAESRRRGLAATQAIFNVVAVNQYPEQDRPAVEKLLWQHYVEPLGGLRSILQAPDVDTLGAAIDRRAEKGLTAGAILAFVLALDHAGHSASVSKATYLLARIAEKNRQRWPPGRPTTERSMLDIWKDYKAVVPLWAAFGHLRHTFEQKLLADSFFAILSPDTLLSLLGAAQIFRGFGTHFCPSEQKRPILDPAETWRCSYKGKLPDISIFVPPWREWESETLKEYQARGRY